MSMEQVRQPIIAVLGHVDSGKTSLQDKIRQSSVAATEAGLITQAIGASEIPMENIKERCGVLLEQLKIDITIPGFLMIDTPGHAAFTTLRKRGGSIADIAVLVVDIVEGFQPQTDESILVLKEFKTPFVVVANKIDRVVGWSPTPGECFLNTLKNQSDRVVEDLENKMYRLVGQLVDWGFDCERYDRVSSFTKQVSIVPVSAKTGEGIPDLLMVLTGLAQRFLQNKIKFTQGRGKGTILEVKEQKGLGQVLDIILYDGEMAKGDHIIIGGNNIVSTKVKAILKPEPLRDIRVESKFQYLDSVTAATGVRISTQDPQEVIAGSPVIIVKNPKDVEKAEQELKREVEAVEIKTDADGAILKADTLGGLEAMIKIFQEMELPIRKAEVGSVGRQDVIEIRNMSEPYIFAFNVKISDEADTLAKDSGVKVFSSPIIYKLVEEYKSWKKEQFEVKEAKLLETVIRPCKLRVLPGCVFRQSKPAIFGAEILAGTVKPKYRLKRQCKVVGEIKEVQKSGTNVAEAVSGDRIAISMDDVVIGKHIFENDVLQTDVRGRDLQILEKVKKKLREDEKALLAELQEEQESNSAI